MENKKYITRHNEGYSYVEIKIDDNNEIAGRFEIPFKPENMSQIFQAQLKELNVGDKINVN